MYTLPDGQEDMVEIQLKEYKIGSRMELIGSGRIAQYYCAECSLASNRKMKLQSLYHKAASQCSCIVAEFHPTSLEPDLNTAV